MQGAGEGRGKKKEPRDKMSQGLLFPVGLFLRRGALRGLFLFPRGQQGHDLVFHLPGRGILAEILVQFSGGNNHLVYLLFLAAQNAVNHIAVQFPVLIQLAELLGLGERGGRRCV